MSSPQLPSVFPSPLPQYAKRGDRDKAKTETEKREGVAQGNPVRSKQPSEINDVTIGPFKKTEKANEFILSTFNIGNLPTGSHGELTKEEMTAFLKEQGLTNSDSIVFTESFDDSKHEILKQSLEELGFNVGKRVGHDGGTRLDGSGYGHFYQDGGIFVATRHSIQEEKQDDYDHSTGSDSYSYKGFVHTKINKNGKTYHVIGTHLQADTKYQNAFKDSIASTGDEPYYQNSEVREKQLRELREYMDKIERENPGEPILLAGDLNVADHDHQFKEGYKPSSGTFTGEEIGYDSGEYDKVFSDETLLGGYSRSKRTSNSEPYTYENSATLDYILHSGKTAPKYSVTHVHPDHYNGKAASDHHPVSTYFRF